MMVIDDLLIGAVVAAIKLSPAVIVLFWSAWRADQRAQECMERLLAHLDKEH